MNQTFSSARFGRLMRKYWRDNGLSLLSMAGVLFIIVAASMAFLVYRGAPNSVIGNRLAGFLGLSLVIWPLFTYQLAADFNKPDQALSALMLPASVFEKWLLLWIITGLGFVLCFFGSFTIVDVVGTYYVNHREWPQATLDYFKQNRGSGTIELADYSELKQTPIWAIWILLNPFTLAVTLLFRKYTLFIGVVVGFALFGFGLYLNQYIVQAMLGESVLVRNVFPFAGFGVIPKTESGPFHYLILPQPIGDIIRWTVGIASVGLLYAVGYFRLKEREI